MNTLAKTTDLFAHTIYEIEFDGYAKIQTPLIDYITSNFNSEFINEYTGHDHPLKAGAVTKIYDKVTYLKEDKQINDPNLKSLFNWITKHGEEYWKILNLSQYLKPYILQLWATGVKQGGFISSHNHNPIPISGVFYLKAEPRLGNLFLENPLDLVLGTRPQRIETRVPTRFNYEVEAISGKLVLFPGWMKHFTQPNPFDDLRMSMAVNFGATGDGLTDFS